ncbi:MAG: hypothetical protein Q9187_004192 [Circinaria calcarea]
MIICEIKSAVDNYHITKDSGSALSRGIRHRIEGLEIGMQNINVNLHTIQTIAQAHEATTEADERRRMLAWLSPLEFWTKQNMVFGRRQEGTCTWFLEDPKYKAWVDRESIIIDDLEQKTHNSGATVAWVYCDYTEQQSQSVDTLLLSIIRQIASGSSAICKAITDSFKHHQKKGTRPNFQETIQMLKLQLQQCHKPYIVIDALDEYGDADDRQRVISVLQGVQPGLQLLVTSRLVPAIKDLLQTDYQLEVKAQDVDIKGYLVERIRTNSRLASHIARAPDLKEAMLHAVLDKVQGMFLLARLHVESLATCTSPRILRERLLHLPESIDSTYEDAIRRVESQDEGHRDQAMRALKWVTHTLRPLSVLELQHALSIEPGDQDVFEEGLPDVSELISSCAGLIVVQPAREKAENLIGDDGIPRNDEPGGPYLVLTHHTAQEYLERTSPRYFPDAQLELAETCLGYLSFDAFHARKDSDVSASHAVHRKYPFLRYAASHWFHHVHLAANDSPLQELLVDLLQSAGIRRSIMSVYHQVHQVLDRYGLLREPELSALHVAAYYNLPPTLTRLIEDGSQIDSIDDDLTPLWLAVSQGHSEIAKLLLENGANPNAVSGYLSDCRICIPYFDNGKLQVREALHWKPRACTGSASRLPVIAAALESGASHIALLQLLRLLLDHGADPEVRNWPFRYVVSECVDQDSPYFVAEESIRSAGYVCKPFSAVEWACCKDDSEYLSTMLDKIVEKRGECITATSLLLYTLESNCTTRNIERMLLSRNDIGLDLEWCWLVAARIGGLRTVRAILGLGVDISVSDGNGRTALHLVSENLQAGCIIPFLIARGADVHRLDLDGRTPVHTAAKIGSAAALGAFLKCSSYLDKVDKRGVSPLRYARDAGDLDSVKLLLPFWSESDLLVKDRWQMSLLGWVEWLGPSTITAFVGYVSGIRGTSTRLNLNTPAGVEDRDGFGRTALIASAICGDIKMVDKLLRWGSDIDWADIQGKTALHHAYEKGFMAIVCLLLGAQVDAKPRDYRGLSLTAWCYAAESGHADIKRLLHCWEVSGCGREGVESPRTLQQWTRTLATAETPVFQRPFHNWPRNRKRFPSLQAAVWSAYLLRRDSSGRTLLHDAARTGNHPFAVKRLEVGLDPHDQDKLGRTPLHYALANCNYSVAEVLMQKMSNYEARDETGSTAFDYAPIYNDDDNNIQKLLKARNYLKRQDELEPRYARVVDMDAR